VRTVEIVSILDFIMVFNDITSDNLVTSGDTTVAYSVTRHEGE